MKIRKIVFSLYSTWWDDIPLMIFRQIWGNCEETKYLTKSEYLIKPQGGDFNLFENERTVFLYPNCNFDSQFGYPCEGEVVSPKKPKDSYKRVKINWRGR